MDAISREVLERQQTFEGADAATGDDDVWGHAQHPYAYCTAPADIALAHPVSSRVFSTKSSRYPRVAARDSSVSSAAVRQTEKKAEGFRARAV